MFLTHALRAIFRAVVAAVTGDSLWKYVTLLLSGTPPAVTFISDASTNNLVVTLNGDTRPSNFNPYTPGYYSNFFDGTGDYLALPAGPAFAPGLGPFTVEGWYYTTASGDQYIWAQSVSGSNYFMVGIDLANSRFLFIGIGYGVYSPATVKPNCWNHFAVVRDATNITVYANGVAGSPVPFGSGYNFNNTTYVPVVSGYTHSQTNMMTGYLSNFRYVKGTAVYTANFTPSTAPLTAITNTSLLTCQSNRLIDNSLNNFAITKNGDTTVSGFIPFVTPTTANVNTLYSTYFGGTTGYIAASEGVGVAPFALGSVFTVECWIYPTVNQNQDLLRCGAFEVGYNGAAAWGIAETGVAWRLTTATMPTLNAWNHIAIVRTGTSTNQTQLYLNGVSVATGTYAPALSSNQDAYIGAFSNGTYPFTGYISNFRVVKGVAVYTGTFTPSTSNLTATQSAGTNISAITGTATSLLTCQDATLKDNSTNLFAVTASGTPLPIAQSPFTQVTTALNTTYLGSGYFDGAGDYLSIPSSSILTVGANPFTVEAWIYPLALVNYSVIAGQGVTADAYWMFTVMSDGAIRQQNYNNVIVSSAVGTIKTGQWQHVALVRDSSNKLSIFVNGISVATTTNSTNWSSISTVYFGALPSESGYFNGYMSNNRIVKGTAVYTANFAPPVSQLTAVTNTQLLTVQTNQPAANKQFVDNSGNNFPVTQAGNATQGTFSPYGANWSNYFTNGQSNYIQTTIQAMTANFTVECWVYLTGLPNAGVIIGYTWEIWINTNGTVSYYTPAAVRITTSLTVPLNTWTHIALVRSSGVARIYINGVADAATYTNSGTVGNLETTYFARDPGASGGYNGYISNLRIVNGTAVYTATFTPSTVPLTAIANTSLLTCQSQSFVDNSPNKYAVTSTGTPSVQRFSPFSPVTQTPQTYSGLFNGSSDYLTWSGTTVGTGAMTFECWFYYTGSFGAIAAFIGPGSAITGGLNCYIENSTSLTFDRYGVAGSTYTVPTIVANTWNHVAFVRNSSNVATVFFNGVRSSTGTTSDTYSYTTSAAIGWCGGAVPRHFAGYISNARLVVGSNVYDPTQSTITVPTTPLTAITNTKLLTCQDATFKDNSTNAFAITATGSPAPRAFNPFGYTNTTGQSYTPALYGGSAYFDGTGDYLTVPDNVAFTMGAGDFTLEAWVYLTTSGVSRIIIGTCDAGGTQGSMSYTLSINGSNIALFSVGYAGAMYGSTNTTNPVPINQWVHIAGVRSGGTAGNIYVYVNGIVSTTNTNMGSLTITDSSQVIGIGRNGAYNGEYLTGYISDARIVKGTAVYKSNFVPPLAPLTAVAGTTLLLNMDKAGVSDSSRSNDLETVGDAKIAYETPYAGSYYSNYFTGVSDYLSFSTITLGSSYTIEFFVNFPTAPSANNVIISNVGVGGGTNWIGITPSTLTFSYGGTTRTFSFTAVGGTWYYVQVIGTASTVSAYVNGSQIGTTQVGPTSFTADRIGGYTSVGLTGYLSNLRVTNAANAVSATPTTPLTAITNTSLLTCQSKSFVDNSSNVFTITRSGTPSIKSFNPFQKNTYSSMFFDGNGDNLAIPTTPNLNMGTGNFTVECWVYISSRTLNYPVIFGNNNNGYVAGAIALVNSNNDSGANTDRFNLSVYDINPAPTLIASSTNSLNTWYHLAVVRNGTSLVMYRDGTSVASATISSGIVFDWGKLGSRIGGGNWDGAQSYFNGYIADLRSTKSARYTATFTPPTAPLLTS